MGGFGAFHYLLVHPEMFASVSSLSGAFKERPIPDLLGDPARSRAAYDRIAIYPGLEAALAKGIHLPPLYLTCGTEDHLIAESRDLRDWLTAKHVAVEYLEKPGVHDWAFWKGCSAAIIDFHWRTFQGNYKPVEHPAAKAAEGTK